MNGIKILSFCGSLILLVLLACNEDNKVDYSPLIFNEETDSIEQDSSSQIFSPVVSELLDHSISAVLENGPNDSCVYRLTFNYSEDTCILEILTSTVIQFKNLKGITYYKDHMIGFYTNENAEHCLSNYVDESLLFTNFLDEKFKQENLSMVPQEPFKWIYRLWEEDGISKSRLIEKGFY